MAIEKERKVNESPRPSDLDVPLVREFGHAINKLIDGPPVVLTADLPAADPKLDGLIVFEDLTGGNFNLIAYALGSRFRFTGTSF